jgi:type I restriction enzyme M protein
MNESALVNKVWNYAHVLRNAGVGYGDYVSQITYLLFLKMDEEREKNLDEPSSIPKGYRWADLKAEEGDDLENQYRHTLEKLAKEKGLLGTIFRKAQNKIPTPAGLRQLVDLIDAETWIGLDVDIKGAIYEGLLERNAEEVKSGAGQYFTPRPIIRAMTEVMRPDASMDIHDPACGTGGFLLAAYEYMKDKTSDKGLMRRLRSKCLSGIDIVDQVVSLCAMNLYLHGIGGDENVVRQGDALIADPGKRFDMILTNPPFGKKGSFTYMNDDGDIVRETESYERDDFKITTTNKQLNFLQHIMTVLKPEGRTAAVLPDNVLFEGGAGEKIRKRLLENFELHTILRLPTGIFYSQGVKANILFFDKKPPSEKVWTKDVWIYDLRTNIHLTLKTNPLKQSDLDDFVKAFNAPARGKRKETDRFKKYSYDEIIKRDKLNLDIFWLKDDSLEDVENLPAPEIIAAEIVDGLEAALEQFRGVAAELGKQD